LLGRRKKGYISRRTLLTTRGEASEAFPPSFPRQLGTLTKETRAQCREERKSTFTPSYRREEYRKVWMGQSSAAQPGAVQPAINSEPENFRSGVLIYLRGA